MTFVSKYSAIRRAGLFAFSKGISFVVNLLTFPLILHAQPVAGAMALAWSAALGFSLLLLRTALHTRYQIGGSRYSLSSLLFSPQVLFINLIVVAAVGVIPLTQGINPSFSIGALPILFIASFDADFVRASVHKRLVFPDLFTVGNTLSFFLYSLSASHGFLPLYFPYVAILLPWFFVAMYNLYFFAPLVKELACNSDSYNQCRGGPPLFMGLYAVVLASVDGIILNAPLILSGLIGSSLAISLVTVSRLFNLSVFCLPLINHSSATRLTSNRYAGWLHEFNKVSTPLFLTSIPILLGAYFFFITYGGIGAILGPNLLPSTMYILISFALYFSVNRSVLHVSSCNPKLMAILLSLLLLCYIFGIVLIMHLELLSLYSITILQCSAFLLSSLVVAVLGLKSPKKTSSNLLPGFD